MWIAIPVIALAPSLRAAEYLRGASVREANMYVSPDSSSAKLGEVTRGREITVLEKSRDWIHVQANLASNPYEQRLVTGWILEKGIVFASTPDADKIIYGEAVDSEDQASHRRGRRGADIDAFRLYYRVYDMFPNSPLAGESLYRAADIKWQLDKLDVYSKPSAREQDAFLRGEIDPRLMKEVIKKFPNTKWAELADYRLLDNKVCGDWQGQSKCPSKEAEMFEKYASEHPQSPKAPEALYEAASRYAALVEIYKTEEQQSKSDDAKSKAIAVAQRLASQFPDSDWGARGKRLVFLVQQDVPTYGNNIQ
jgi:Bacterial SH3 domain